MKMLRSIKQLERIVNAQRGNGKRIGFVPTMGDLHEGHLSLVRRARRENGCVVISIFVNPTQFGPGEDFKRYPRHLKRDKACLEKEGVDYLFVPDVKTIYPKGIRATIPPGPLARYLCGRKRPEHFRGVATVVKRLFEIVKPDTAYFGEKDFQQARIIEGLVRRYRMPVRIRTVPIVRESDGLAMSSRNRYLNEAERRRAPVIRQSLLAAKQAVRKGLRDTAALRRLVREKLDKNVSKIDYVEVVHPQTLKPLHKIGKEGLIAVACYLGRARLIDNLRVRS